MYAKQILSNQWTVGLTGLWYIDPYPHWTSGLHIPIVELWYSYHFVVTIFLFFVYNLQFIGDIILVFVDGEVSHRYSTLSSRFQSISEYIVGFGGSDITGEFTNIKLYNAQASTKWVIHLMSKYVTALLLDYLGTIK